MPHTSIKEPTCSELNTDSLQTCHNIGLYSRQNVILQLYPLLHPTIQRCGARGYSIHLQTSPQSLLALTRRGPVAEEPKTNKKKAQAQSETPIFFNAEVLDAVMAAVGGLSQATKGIGYYGTSNRREWQYNKLTIL